jgi:hypothetical protein
MEMVLVYEVTTYFPHMLASPFVCSVTSTVHTSFFITCRSGSFPSRAQSCPCYVSRIQIYYFALMV